MTTERWVRGIWKANPGATCANPDVLPVFEARIRALPVDEARRATLLDALKVFMLGNRSRWGFPGWATLSGFASRAAAFEAGAEEALEALAAQVREAAPGVRFDAVVTTTSTGNLMPGLSYRLARRLPEAIGPDSMLLDLGNVGCTGSVKALKAVSHLGPEVRDALVVAVELPTTLIDLDATEVEVWRGNGTFGDGAAAVWVSTEPGDGPRLRLGPIHYVQRAAEGLSLIRWGYRDYYQFQGEAEQSFDHTVRTLVGDALQAAPPGWIDTPFWAIHPAGIAVLMRVGRKVGMPRQALEPAIAHYERYSNMSSASILHVLDDVAASAPSGARINLLTMGAGFNVLHGSVFKE